MLKNLILVLSFATFFLHSKSQTITLDTSRLSFPFDRPFELKYVPKNKVSIFNASLFETDKHGCLMTSQLVCRKKYSFLARLLNTCSYCNRNTDIEGYTLALIPDSNGVKIKIPSLAPNRSYTIFFTAMTKVAGIDAVVDLLYKNDVLNASRIYDSIRNAGSLPINKGFGCDSCVANTFEIYDIDAFKTFYLENIAGPRNTKEIYQQAIDSIKKLPVIYKAPAKIVPTLYNNVVKELLAYFPRCQQCNDSAYDYQRIIHSRENLSLLLLNLYQLNDSLVYSGVIPIDSIDYVTPPANITMNSRLLNLARSIQVLRALENVARYYYASLGSYTSANRSFITEIEKAILDLRNNYTTLSNNNNLINKNTAAWQKTSTYIDSLLLNYHGFYIPFANISADNYTYNFVTRADFTLKADFGFIAYGNLTAHSTFRGFSPYLGFHVNFRPYNTEGIFKRIPNKTFWEHLSFNSGLLLSSFKEDGVRDGLVGNYALFTGLGYAFSHGVRLTAGSVWYRKEDVQPFKNHKTTAATPYVGLALDLRFRAIYEGFAKIFQ
jgi:hypothetical protein